MVGPVCRHPCTRGTTRRVTVQLRVDLPWAGTFLLTAGRRRHSSRASNLYGSYTGNHVYQAGLGVPRRRMSRYSVRALVPGLTKAA